MSSSASRPQGILVSSSGVAGEVGEGVDGSGGRVLHYNSHSNLHVKFNEEMIKEHDKLRGTRQKIDEPDTPYHRGSFDESEPEESFSNVASKPNSVSVVFSEDASAKSVVDQAQQEAVRTEVQAAAQMQHGQQPSADGGLNFSALAAKLEDVNANKMAPAAVHATAHDEFAAKRKQHYNEFEMMRKFREEHSEDLDES